LGLRRLLPITLKDEMSRLRTHKHRRQVAPRRCRTLAALAACSLAALLNSAPAALGAGDPVASGTFRLQYSDAFKNHLRHSHVSIKGSSFAVRGGSIDPTTGAGSLTLKGKLTFKHGHEKVVFRNLEAKLGPGGVLKSDRTKLFGLSGGSVTRNGFGAEISGVEARFLKSAAKKLRKNLEVRSLRQRSAGTLSVSEQPQTVEIITGTATLTPELGPGSIASKLAAHCIDSNTGVSVIAPGVQPGGPGTTFTFPVTFGTISPSGTAGLIQQVGGIQLANGGAGLPSGCPASSTVTIQLSDLGVDLEQKVVYAHVAINGPGSPFGNLDTGVSFPIDVSETLINADPAGLAVAANGTVIQLNYAAAYMLNQFFPQPAPADPSLEFSIGDVFGTAGLTVQVR
jgi:hypothetical protein